MTIRERILIAEAYQASADRLKEAADRAAKRAVEEWLNVWQAMEDEGWDEGDDTKLRGTRYAKQVTYYGQVNDPLLFNEWAAHFAPHLIQPRPRKALINEEVQRRVEDGEELPPGVTAWPKRWVSRRAV